MTSFENMNQEIHFIADYEPNEKQEGIQTGEGNTENMKQVIYYCWLWTNYSRMSSARAFGRLCWGLTSQSTIFQSCRDGAIASWVINQYFRGVKCLAQGHNTAAVGIEPRTSLSGVRHSTTEPPRSPAARGHPNWRWEYWKYEPGNPL